MFTPNDEFTEKDMEDIEYDSCENEQNQSAEEEEEEADPSFANVDKIEDKDDSWGSDNEEILN